MGGPVSASGGAEVCSDCGSCAREPAGKKNIPTATIEAKQNLTTAPAAAFRIIESFRPYYNGLVRMQLTRFSWQRDEYLMNVLGR